MYQLSRSLYRELAVMLPDSDDESAERDDRKYLIETCEAAMQRLVFEPETCGTPAKSLFRDVRHLFPVDAQIDAWRIVTFHVDAARVLSSRIQDTLRRECQAVTRSGTPCQREPRPGRRYCPSHYSLESTEDLAVAVPVA